VDFGWNVAADVSARKPSDIGSTADGGLVEGSHAKTRRRERLGIAQVPQLPKTFCGNEGVMKCSGLTELGMGPSALMEKSKAVSSHRSPRNKDPA
jgi:hypothetical protein